MTERAANPESTESSERFYRLHKAKLWLYYRLHPKHRYHMINTGLSPGYYDEDMLILYGCFAMLGRYIESQGGTEALDAFNAELRLEAEEHEDQEGSKQADRQEEALNLWHWWTIERPAMQKRHDELLHILYGDKEDGTERMSFRKVEGTGLSELVMEEHPDKAMKREFRRLEDKIADDEQAMLHRLIDIRPSLWT